MTDQLRQQERDVSSASNVEHPHPVDNPRLSQELAGDRIDQALEHSVDRVLARNHQVHTRRVHQRHRQSHSCLPLVSSAVSATPITSLSGHAHIAFDSLAIAAGSRPALRCRRETAIAIRLSANPPVTSRTRPMR